MFFKCGRYGCGFEAPTSKSVSCHQSFSAQKRKSTFSIHSHCSPCRGYGILCVTAISKSGVCLPQATTWHEAPSTPPLPRAASSMSAQDSLEVCDNIDVDADSWTERGEEAGASSDTGVYKSPALPAALALCCRVTEDQEKRWNADDEHAEFMRLFLRVVPGCAPLSPQAGKILTEDDIQVLLWENPMPIGLRERTWTETSFYNFVTQHRLSRATSTALLHMLRNDFFIHLDLHYLSMQKWVEDMVSNAKFPLRSVDLSQQVETMLHEAPPYEHCCTAKLFPV
jgi:hypothetical protein